MKNSHTFVSHHLKHSDKITKMIPNVGNKDLTPVIKDQELKMAPQTTPWTYQVEWKKAGNYAFQHLTGIYGFYLLLTTAMWSTIAFSFFVFYISVTGVCVGTHRMWCHRSFKVKLPLEIFLMFSHCLSNQHTIFTWARDHRVHHKYSDTDADPYNASRGFFFSHFGWFFLKNHPEFEKKKNTVDMSDLLANPVVMFQKRHVNWLNTAIAIILPSLIPIYFWNETASNSFFVNMLRITLGINAASSVNSFAHMFGTKPYDKRIAPTQNLFTILLCFGEGFHNYHHSFPFDYKAGEFGNILNFNKSFIDFFAWLGLAYDLKTVSDDVLKKRMMRTGDGSTDKYGTGLGMMKDLLM